MNQRLIRLFFLLWLFALAMSVRAQWSPPPPLETVDLPAANAKTIVTGYLQTVGQEATPGAFQVEIAVKETLKGVNTPTLTSVIRVQANTDQLKQWQTSRDVLLFAIPADPSSRTTIIDLSDKDLAVISADLKLLTKPAEVIEAVKEAVRASEGMSTVGSMWKKISASVVEGSPLQKRAYVFPDKTFLVTVPIDHRVEKEGVQQLKSPKTRLSAIGILSHFNSRANISRLEPLLKSNDWIWSFSYEGSKEYVFQENPVRTAAFQALRSFGLTEPEPLAIKPSDRREQVVSADLNDGVINPSDIAELQSYPNLIDLSFASAYLTDADFLAIEKLHPLRMLYFQGSNVSDDALARLASLPNLRYVNLAATKITDKGLKELERFKSLRKVELGQDCSAEGISELRKRRPGIDVQPDEFAFLSGLHPQRIEMGFRGRLDHPPGQILGEWRYGLIFPKKAAAQVDELLKHEVQGRGWKTGCPSEHSPDGFYRDLLYEPGSKRVSLREEVYLPKPNANGVEEAWDAKSEPGGRVVVVERLVPFDN